MGKRINLSEAARTVAPGGRQSIRGRPFVNNQRLGPMQSKLDHESTLDTTVQLIEYLRTASPIKMLDVARDGSLNVTFNDETSATYSVEELLSTTFQPVSC